VRRFSSKLLDALGVQADASYVELAPGVREASSSAAPSPTPDRRR
jgi:hypothetical protein